MLGGREDSHSFLFPLTADDDDDEVDNDKEDEHQPELTCGQCSNGSDEVLDVIQETSTSPRVTNTGDYPMDRTATNLTVRIPDETSIAVTPEEIANDATSDLVDDDSGADDAESVVYESDDDGANDDDDDSAISLQREGLALHRPVSILEIGCGDVPLGVALADDLQTLQDATGVPSSSVVTNICCTDYSQVVVDMMQKEHGTKLCSSVNAASKEKTHQNIVPGANGQTSEHSKSLDNTDSTRVSLLQFMVADARQLPYEDNSFTLVLEKGTLDAMLSDTEQGIADCIQIVAECARVASTCIVLISHLNAHTPDGARWLEEILIGGLQQQQQQSEDNQTNSVLAWEIEVHGNSEIVQDDNHKRIPVGSSGPAVYIVHKRLQSMQSADARHHQKSSVAVKFFSY
jgi:Methyltransferase domain